ncbi:MAG: hypothetical protein R3331_05220 [Sulfurospirillaceae bacterium]|nr:hypothetical protein [Sulfurospirillaceae bacterium]
MNLSHFIAFAPFFSSHHIQKLARIILRYIKPCHCNCIFRLKIRLILLLNIFIPRCPYYCTYFAFRRTGVHPPFSY